MIKRFDYLDLVLIGAVIFSLTFLGVYFYFDKPTQEVILNEVIDDITICENKSLVDTSECLKDYVSTFFFYNISQKGKTLTEEELKQSGGVCSSASEYYKQKAESLGFYGTTCDMDVYKSNGTLHRHEIAIISNYEGYIILDQKDLIGIGYFDINESEVENETK